MTIGRHSTDPGPDRPKFGPAVAVGVSGRANVAMSPYELAVPPVNGFLNVPPPAGRFGATAAAVPAYTPLFCTP